MHDLRLIDHGGAAAGYLQLSVGDVRDKASAVAPGAPSTLPTVGAVHVAACNGTREHVNIGAGVHQVEHVGPLSCRTFDEHRRDYLNVVAADARMCVQVVADPRSCGS